MAAGGRGSAVAKAGGLLLFLLVALPLEMSGAATYTVGDSHGWSFVVSDWPRDKRFLAGDILVFNYRAAVHNVALVDKAGYDSCTVPVGAKIYDSGNDQITLVKGDNFFICGIPGHCEGEMKIAVTAH